MQLLPQGTLRRRVFEWCDRKLGRLFFGNDKTVSTNCGDRIQASSAGCACRGLCRALDALERDHCVKNAGKS